MGATYAASDAAVGRDHRAAASRPSSSPEPARGKTTLMAAARGLARGDRPGPARGGARPDLHHQGRRRAAPAGHAPRWAPPGLLDRSRRSVEATRTSSSRRSRPTTPTPPASSPTTACGSATSPTPGSIADASRYQLGARVIDRFTGARRAADRPPRDRHPEPPRPRRRDERAPRRRRRRTPRRRARPAAGSSARSPRSRPARPARPTSSRRRRRSTRSTGAPSCSQLVDGLPRGSRPTSG